MSGHSILYLGRGEFAADYLAELETLPCCTLLIRSNTYELPENAPWIDVVLLEAGPMVAQSGKSLPELIRSFEGFPVVALTSKEHEHRGIAAVRAQRTPRWYTGLCGLVAVVAVVSVIDTVSTATGGALAGAAFLGFIIWTLTSAVVMLRRPLLP